MQNSDNSSPATESAPAGNPHPRNRFALTGRSAQIDPRHEAVRRDLADVRLANRVFAPHYAAHLPHVASRATDIRASREPGSEVLAALNPGDLFEVLELSAGLAWGSAPGQGVVGYVDAADLGRVA